MPLHKLKDKNALLLPRKGLILTIGMKVNVKTSSHNNTLYAIPFLQFNLNVKVNVKTPTEVSSSCIILLSADIMDQMKPHAC